MKYDIAGLDLALKTLINEFYPYTDSFSDELYTLDDVVHQLIFEIIKEEYKQYAPKKTVMDFLGDYDVDGSNRKYTRALQYAQHYRDHDNDLIENELGMRVPELEAQDMSGAKVFKGHQLTAHEFLGLKLQAESRLLNKLHEGQIESSKKVSEPTFQELFEEYTYKQGKMDSPAIRKAEEILNTRGTAPRTYRNMLAFVAPDQSLLSSLQKAVSDLLAWESIKTDSTRLNLDAAQNAETASNISRCNEAVNSRLKEVYSK